MVGTNQDHLSSVVLRRAVITCRIADDPGLFGLEEPVQCKGSVLFELYKGSGATYLASRSRDIHVATEYSKSGQRHLRPLFLE